MRIRRRAGRRRSRTEEAAWTVLSENEVRVRRWREDGEAYAYRVHRERVIEAPWPDTAAALAVLCHEVAHHALGHTHWPEWATARRELEEEGEAWAFTFACFARFGLAVPAAVARQVAESLAERLAAALEEGLDPVPVRFQPFEEAARSLLAGRRAARYNESGGSPNPPAPQAARNEPP